MLNKLLNDEKTFRIFCLILFAILFFIVLKKTNSEKFSVTNNNNLSQEQLVAIKNLGNLAKTIYDSSSGELDLSGINLKLNRLTINDGTTDFNILETIKNIQATNVNQGVQISTAQKTANEKTTNAQVDTKLAGYIRNNAKVNIYQDLASGPTDLIRVDGTTVIQHNDSGSYHNCSNATNSAWVIKTCS